MKPTPTLKALRERHHEEEANLLRTTLEANHGHLRSAAIDLDMPVSSLHRLLQDKHPDVAKLAKKARKDVGYNPKGGRPKVDEGSAEA